MAADGSYTYTPKANFNGTDTVDYTVTDGALTDVGTLTLNVAAVNDVPVITSTSVLTGTVIEDTTLEATGQITAIDVDADTLNYTITAAAYGTMSIDATGQWHYILTNDTAAAQILQLGQTLIDSVTISVNDGHGGITTSTVSINIQGSDDPNPVVTLQTTAPAVLEATGNTTGSDYYPQITAVGSGGDYVVTWVGEDSTANGGDASIYVQKFNADGTAASTTPVMLEATGNTLGVYRYPQITAVGSGGDYVVTWAGEDSTANGRDYGIYVQKFNADGTAASTTPVMLEATGNTTGYNYAPQITAVGSGGDYVVTWAGEDSTANGGDYSIYVQKFNADGTVASTPPVMLEATGNAVGHDTAPQITAVGSGGDYVVTWVGQDSTANVVDESIYVQKFNADGTVASTTPVMLEATGNTIGYNYAPQITAVGSGGDYVVTWVGEDSTANGGDMSIYVQKFNADGTAASTTPVMLEATGNTTGSDYKPQITAVGSGGDYVVTWYGKDSTANGEDYNIYVQKFNADGTAASTTPVMLEATGNTTGYNHAPQITAVGSGGDYVVTWVGKESTDNGEDESIYVQKFNADGTLAAPVRLEATGSRIHSDDALQITAVGSGGDYVVTWSEADSAATDGDYSIYVQKSNADGTAATVNAATDLSANAAATVVLHANVTGTLYLVLDGALSNPDQAALDAYIANTANDAKENHITTTANTDVTLSLATLEAGTYHAYVVDSTSHLVSAMSTYGVVIA